MSNLEVYKSIASLRGTLDKLKENNSSVALVPTMGALHHGHIELVKQALEIADFAVVSIFVNPKQFNNPSDLENYPRTLDEDLALLEVLNNCIVFLPTVEEMYPPSYQSVSIDLGILDETMEAVFRPGHFEGVVNVVHRLFTLVKPNYALFGLKDVQQLCVIQKMVDQLSMDVKIVPCEIIREESGLASSSRNKRLSDREKEEAVIIYETMVLMQGISATYGVEQAKSMARSSFEKSSLKLEYLEVIDPVTFEATTEWVPGAIVCIAAYCGPVRLIDNMELIPKAVFC